MLPIVGAPEPPERRLAQRSCSLRGKIRTRALRPRIYCPLITEISYTQTLEALRQYREARDWQKFHLPKDLAIAVSTEAAELLEHFQWRNRAALEDYLREHVDEIEQEVADIAIYLLFFCDALGFDLLQAVNRKLRINQERHPVERARGRARVEPDS